MITSVSKENNFGPDDKIRYIWGLKGPIYYVLWPQEFSLSQVSDKGVMVIC